MKEELIVAAACIQHDNKILLCQRHQHDHYGGLWEFPGGKVESNETLAEAVIREINEELGVEVRVEKLLGQISDEDPNLKIQVSLFACVVVKGILAAKDCQAFGFFDLAEIKKLALAPADRKLLKLTMYTS